MVRVLTRNGIAGLVLLLGAAAPALPAKAAGDVARGADLFDNYCSECHTTRDGGSSRSAPNLFGLIGRHPGSVKEFNYSDANRSADWIWSAETLDPYLAAPKTAMPGTVMKFQGVKSAGERADLIAFLLSLHS